MQFKAVQMYSFMLMCDRCVTCAKSILAQIQVVYKLLLLLNKQHLQPIYSAYAERRTNGVVCSRVCFFIGRVSSIIEKLPTLYTKK